MRLLFRIKDIFSTNTILLWQKKIDYQMLKAGDVVISLYDVVYCNWQNYFIVKETREKKATNEEQQSYLLLTITIIN